MVVAKIALSCALLANTNAEIHDRRDLQRARSKVPRSSWKGEGRGGVSDTLNGHLQKMFPLVKDCSEWTAEELQVLQTELFSHRNEDFNGIYDDSSDNRMMLKSSIEEYRQHWEEMNNHAERNPHLKDMHRDAHCNEAVMWLVHHVNAPEQQTVFARTPVPMLSTRAHQCGENLSDSEAALCASASGKETCMECHSNSGMQFQDADLDGKIEEDPKYPGFARMRRCDQNYDPPCGPCEGVGGPYWSDAVNGFQPTNCELIAAPEDVPEADRTTPELGQQFTVHQLGSDRLSRVQNQGGGKLPPLYSQIRSTLWFDSPTDEDGKATAEDGMFRLRHDSYYDDLIYKPVLMGKPVTEFHFQTEEQRTNNITGPMVSLVHSILGTPIPGGCGCNAAPTGVPVLGGFINVNNQLVSAFREGATYMGRVNLGIEYDGYKLGDKGHGDKDAIRNMTVDHFSKWFLHLFIDADPASPTYNRPVRFYGPYSGFAVYVQKDDGPPPAEVWDTACVINGWGTSDGEVSGLLNCHKPLAHYNCMNYDKSAVCEPYEGKNTESDDVDVHLDYVRGSSGSFIVPHQEAELLV